MTDVKATQLTPLERLNAAPQAAKRRGRGPVLSDTQRAARKQIVSMARQRAYRVLIALHRDEFNALVREERAILVARADEQIAETGTYDLGTLGR